MPEDDQFIPDLVKRIEEIKRERRRSRRAGTQ